MAERAWVHHNATIPPRVVDEIDEDSFVVGLCAHAAQARRVVSEEVRFRRQLVSVEGYPLSRLTP